MLVRDVMTSPVVRISPEATVAEALRLMMERRVDGLPIVDDRNGVVGILTYADLLRRVRRHNPQVADFFLFPFYYQEEDEEVSLRVQRILEMRVTEVCSRMVVTCGPEGHLADVAGMMVDHRIKRMPVVTEDGTLVGIISRGDVMRAVWERYGSRPKGVADQEE